MTDRRHAIDTLAIHAGYDANLFHGAAVAPIFHTTTYLQTEKFPQLRYHRLHNSPGHDRLSARISALEGTEDAIVLGSGMAAIATSLFAVTTAGDHIIAQANLYGGTNHFLTEEWKAAGRSVSFFPEGKAAQIESMITAKTRAIYIEGLSNPLIRGHDYTAIVNVAKQHGLLTLVDNTLPSPVNFLPASLGFDLVIHSATKYMNGHSDVIAGTVAGSHELISKVRTTAKYFGGSLDAHAVALLERGLKTMPLRVRAQNATTCYLAKELERHPRIKSVSYPALTSHPDHVILQRYLKGFGGLFAFDIDGNPDMVQTLMERLKLFLPAPSLGSVESLITIPVLSSHVTVTPKERKEQGITDTLVRVAVGLEDKDDLLDDLSTALSSLSR